MRRGKQCLFFQWANKNAKLNNKVKHLNGPKYLPYTTSYAFPELNKLLSFLYRKIEKNAFHRTV